MALWPFRRKSRRKRGRANTMDVEESRGQALPPRSQTVPEVAMVSVGPAPERRRTKKQRTESNKLQRRPRAYSFSPGRHDSIRVGRRTSTRARREADIPLSNAASVDVRMGNYDDGIKDHSGMGAVNDEMLRRAPTLRGKRDGDPLPRKMSSKKRRKEDHQREAEIKAMSRYMPVRPAAEDWMLGRPVKKESRRVKTGFGSGFKGHEWERYNRSSDISLPLPESIDSAFTSDSDYISYKVSALEALAPRPTLRYTASPRPGACLRDGAGLFRRPSQQKKLSAPIPEATLKAHKRIDSLADDLSASDLRELMERDQRRRERKRQREQEKLEQRIARRAEKQKAAEAEALRHGRESPPNLERGVLGREDVGLGIDPASAVVTSSKIRLSNELPKQQDNIMKGDELEATRDDGHSHPLATFHRIDSIPLQTLQAPEVKEERVPAFTNTVSRSSFRRKLSRSKSPQESEEQSEPAQKGSETSSIRGPLWASLIRWANRRKRNSGGPSSFSNASRDSMQTTPVPTPPVHFVPRQLSSGVPKRTMSRFREDLPELPISPPASRIQSPEVEAVHPIVETSPDLRRTAGEVMAVPVALGARYDTPVSEQRSVEAMRQTPSTFSHQDEPGISPEPQAMSLASIDSEGSWFSGRIQTPESDNERIEEHDDHIEDMSIVEDDYLSRLAPPNADRAAWNRKSTGEARPSSDWEDEPHWGSVRGQQPTVVHAQSVGRMRSREGLLKSFDEEGENSAELADQANNDCAGAEAEKIEGLQRARSINLGKGHARRISAGSARLLSISPRSSVDAKRTSLSPAPEGS
ncbi:hypothetical protein MMYC01_201593 [Madurella mycetomatis]|uniref:Uncharacterized protein n=1 Tax=Madurella mycetomatis TaxID=100816 RepID=A0A175WBP4_9PEZI|nr:hypothetical protein MMYC01_201593 [Madurella mycetomatis]